MVSGLVYPLENKLSSFVPTGDNRFLPPPVLDFRKDQYCEEYVGWDSLPT